MKDKNKAKKQINKLIREHCNSQQKCRDCILFSISKDTCTAKGKNENLFLKPSQPRWNGVYVWDNVRDHIIKYCCKSGLFCPNSCPLFRCGMFCVDCDNKPLFDPDWKGFSFFKEKKSKITLVKKARQIRKEFVREYKQIHDMVDSEITKKHLDRAFYLKDKIADLNRFIDIAQSLKLGAIE